MSTQPDQKPRVRYASKEDVPQILSMIHELAAYEKEPPSTVKTTVDSLTATLAFPPFPSPTGFARTLLIFAPAPTPAGDGTAGAEPERPAGMALFFYNYSTWTGPGVYLEDLFVRPEFRGKGYGTVLLKELAKVVKEVDGTRLEWSVLKWNQPSIDFYVGKSINATRKEEWLGMRVDGEALDKLAAGDSLREA